MSRGEDQEAQARGRKETELERWDRNFTELLQELRVAQTGVQILFAFLLTLAFTQRFTEINTFQRWWYIGTLIAAAGSTAMIIAPVSYHRLMFRRGRKPELVRASHRLASGGLVLLLCAMVGAVFLVVDFVVGQLPGVVIASGVAIWFVAFWYALPLVRRDDTPGPGSESDEPEPGTVPAGK